MGDAKDFSLFGKDRGEWDRSWSEMPHRWLPSGPNGGVRGAVARGMSGVESCSITLDPPAFSEGQFREGEECPICGAKTRADDRLPASLHPRWGGEGKICIGVWVHASCFARCEETGESCPIPL